MTLLLGLVAARPTEGQVAVGREVEILLHDANPRFTRVQALTFDEMDPTRGMQYLGGWGPERLATVNAPREGTSTDGVSRLLVRVEAPGPGTVELALVTPRPENGTLRFLSGPEVVQVGDRFLAFALYRPPEHFGPRDRADGLWHEEVDFRSAALQARFTGADGRVAETTSLIVLVRPPLVLVHGTFDQPEAAWRTASDLGPAPVDVFAAAGFRPFTVDYSWTSGNVIRDNPFLSTSFQANRRVVLDNTGGIRTALDHYRTNLGIAAARADVVGHSLGGTLGRVLASTYYNPDYLSAENFNQGWINRLITVNTPHHGTELPDMMSFFEEVGWENDRTWTEYFASLAVRMGAWFSGRSASAMTAVENQLPRSPALDSIGPTTVPSHAVVGVMDISRLEDDTPTQGLFTSIALLFYTFPGL
ncbi:esterase/lipase family protein, partial [Gemmatimonadota bacterium]